MLTNQLKRIDKDKIHPRLFKIYCEVLEECNSKGKEYYAISGYRDPKEQQALFDQGRTKPGNIVTNSEGFKSYHNFGLAIDSSFDGDLKREGLQPSWDVQEYRTLAEVSKTKGLQSGLYFAKLVDAPHVQLALPSGISLDMLKVAFKKGGLEEVWKLVP